MTMSAHLKGDDRLRLAVLCLGVWLHAANSMLTATTLPSAVREFGGGHLISWAFTLYLLGSILAGAATAILLRRISVRAAMSYAALLYAAGCVACALAPHMYTLLLGRLLQGVGGGFIIALTFVGLGRWFDVQLIPRLMAMISAIWSLSAFCGPLVGGTFSTFGLWRWAFWVFVIKALCFIVACKHVLPGDSAAVSTSSASPQRFPVQRLAILSIAILSVATAGTVNSAAIAAVLCFAGVGLLWLVFVLDQQHPVSKLFPSGALSVTQPVGAGLVFVLSASTATMAFMVYGPILLETLHGVSPLAAGYIVAFESIAWGIGAVTVARLPVHLERYSIRLGAVLILLGIVGFSLNMQHGPLWLVVFWAGCQGMGFGISWAFIVKRVTAAAITGENDVAAASIPTLQQVGFALGASAAGIVAALAGFGSEVSVATATASLPWIFLVFAPFGAIAVFAVWQLTRIKR